jgi:hypothetical protein
VGTNSKAKKQKGCVGISQNHQAFTAVCRAYRRTFENSSNLRALDYQHKGSQPTVRGRPTPSDYRCDVELAVKRALPSNVSFERFRAAFLIYEFRDDIAQLKFAIAMLGESAVWSCIGGCGAAFRKRSLHIGYFTTVRRRPGDPTDRGIERMKLEPPKPMKANKSVVIDPLEPETDQSYELATETEILQQYGLHDSIEIEVDPFARQSQSYEESDTSFASYANYDDEQ